MICESGSVGKTITKIVIANVCEHIWVVVLECWGTVVGGTGTGVVQRGRIASVG